MKRKNWTLPLAVLLAGASAWASPAPEPPLEEPWRLVNCGPRAEGTLAGARQRMTIATRNTRHAFFEADECSFAFLEQPFPWDDCSRSTVTVTIDPLPAGSAGIMMRASERADAANVHLEATSTGDLFLFFRQSDGASTVYRRAGSVAFPCRIRLTRQGDTFMSHWLDARGEWIKGPTVTARVGESQIVGFYASSGDDSQIGYHVESDRRMQATFRDWEIGYEEHYTPAERDFVDSEPAKEGTLLRENFADGSLSNAPASATNPLWEGIRHAELPRDAEERRYWRKRGDGIYRLGDKRWADYEVAIDLAFDEKTPPTGEFTVEARYQHISVYEKMLRYYGVTLRGGDRLTFDKYVAGGNTVQTLGEARIAPYADGARHRLCIRLLDRDWEVLWDGRSVIRGTDAERPITYGNVALKFVDAEMKLYRIEVTEIEDPINGSADNYLMDYYDTPLPAWMERYGYPAGK